MWDQPDARPALGAPPRCASAAVSAAAGELRTRPAYALTPAGLDYEAMTVPVEKATLLTNPTGIFAKEPTLWWQLQQLMEGPGTRVYLQTPLCRSQRRHVRRSRPGGGEGHSL
ncbi:MAG: hypothetical protein ACLSAF_20150 [Intestinimonas sp.]